MRRTHYLIALCISLLSTSADAQPCRLALVLALDVSGSVNEAEYAQQLNGLAHALDSPKVRTAILSGSGASVRLAVFEWSSQNHQFIIQPWISLDNHDAIDLAVENLRAYRKKRAGLKTALSTAMLFASNLLRTQPECWQHTIDVSGDGKNNIGPAIRQTYQSGLFSSVTVNALVVGDPSSSQESPDGLTKSELLRYYQENVIRGSGSFAMIANGYSDYGRAMQLKLLRELALPVIGRHVRP